MPDQPTTLYQPSRLTPDRSLGGTRSTSHRWAEMPGNWDRLNTRALFPSDNEWGIPALPAAGWLPARLVAYNARRQIETAGLDAAVHFFLDDYRFEVCWSKPERAISRPQRLGAALTPDFSLWADMPLSMQLWQVYRSRWCGAWMLHHGIRVIPTISWSTADTFDFAFAGVTPGSVVAISTVGVRGAEAEDLFAAGFAAMVARLQPAIVIVYGRPPAEQVSAGTPVRCYPTRWAAR
jgi:Domain of unknown function (DUF4417)